MVHIHLEHWFPGITPAQFFALLFDPAYDAELTPVLGVKSRAELDREETDEVIRRHVRMVPGMPIPGAVHKLMGGKELEYLEEAVLNKRTLQMTWSSAPNLFAERVVAKGTVVATAERGGVRRVIDGEITVAVVGLGGLIERLVRENVERSYERASQFTLQWISEGKHIRVKGWS